ncbi:MAG TPA: phosphatase PAP2 family protein [Halothiobacillus sp.]|nr:phosphatase PAP2 family protein [Halothiobacillus sp.]
MNANKGHLSTWAQDPMRDATAGMKLAYGFIITASIALILVAAIPHARMSLFHSFNNLGPLAPAFWSGLSSLADTYLALGLLLPFLLWRPRLAALLLLSAILATLITHTLKPILDVSRPPAVLAADAFHLIGHRLDHGSFPSGHAVTAFTLAGLLIIGLRLSFGWALLALIGASFFAISRMAVGVHWPTDVLAGSVIGLVSVLLGQRLLSRWHRLQRANWPIPVALVISGTCALSAPWFSTGYPLGIWANWGVAIMGLGVLLLASQRYWPAYRNRKRLPLRDLGRPE